MGDNHDGLTFVLLHQAVNTVEYAYLVLSTAFPPDRRCVIWIVCCNCISIFLVPLSYLLQSHSLATAEMPLSQSLQKCDGQMQGFGNRLRSLTCAQQVAAVQGSRGKTGKTASYSRRLCFTIRVKRQVHLTLQSQFNIPVRFTMADKADTSHFLRPNILDGIPVN